MSPREKKLLIFFLVGGLVMLNLFGLSFYQKKRQDLASQRLAAEKELRMAHLLQEGRDEVIKDMEWLEQHQPETAELSKLHSALLDFCKDTASDKGLEVKKFNFAKIENQPEQHYHRAGVRLTITGMEQDLYNCLHQITQPEKFRAVTRIIIAPNNENDELIDCEAVIEQWFIPKPTS